MREPAAGTVVMHDNITQSKQTELRLDDERTLLGTLLATIPDLVWLKDPTGVYLTCNAQFEALFGARQADIIGKTDHDFVPAAQAEEYLRGDRQAMDAARPCLFEEWITYASDGRRALVETTRTPMLDGRGVLVGVLGVARDITERHNMQQQVQQLALFDPLTHLANRRLLGDRLGQAIATCRRVGGGLAVMFIDLDNFKPINDTHGHRAGDLLLVEVARRLKASVRETDTVARFGGDEFVVMVGRLDADAGKGRVQAANVAKKLREALAVPFELSVGEAGQAPTRVIHRCTASFGVAMLTGVEARAEDLLRWADMAMYKAKGAGRNRVHFFARPTEAPMERRTEPPT
jgi:diguanylate cyclase (GGDEF)-like protein/PAS domain S-box-containing protein